MASTVILKKYANRRLYDTEKSAYVTLMQVADDIRAGREVVVIDAKTREDATAFTLTQIVLEEAKNKNILLPVPLLYLIIRFGDNLLGEFLEKHLSQIFQNFVAHKQAMDDQFKQWIEIGLKMSETAQKSFSAMSLLQGFRAPFAQDPEKKE